MSCGNCSTKDSGIPNGCKSNGSCGTGSCDKLTVFDWLSNMELPTGQKPFDIVEVRFKNGRKHFFKNEKNFQLTIGEVIAVEGNPGHDIGTVSLTGELVKIQMKKKKVALDSEEVKKIYRKATVKDIDTWEVARNRETETQKKGREIIIKLGLNMKLSDVEYQGDGNKATFYYTADERVDFRQLIRELASAFSIRVEMKQVGLRQEAARLGGVGSCGRELCCSTWLTDFRKVNTAAARYQQLSLNPQKLAGQCGKLKCCLNYELDGYLEALNTFPKQDTKIYTEKGTAVCQKVDIFKGVLWYAYEGDWMNWFTIAAEDATEMISLNKQKKPVAGLEDYALDDEKKEVKINFENVVGQDSLTRFDQPKARNNRRKKSRKPNSNNKHKGKTQDGDTAIAEKTPQSKQRPNKRRKPNNNKPQGAKDSQNSEAKSTEGGNVSKKRPQRRKPRANNKQNNKPNSNNNQNTNPKNTNA